MSEIFEGFGNPTTQVNEAGAGEPVSSATAALSQTTESTEAPTEGKKKRHRSTKVEMQQKREDAARENSIALRAKHENMIACTTDPALCRTGLSIQCKLQCIREEIQCNKDQSNVSADGRRSYQYRSLGAIYEALKPLLIKYGCEIHEENDIVYHSDNYCHVKCRITLVNLFPIVGIDIPLSFTGFAREAQSIPGFDPAQITGSATTYARKSALSSLLLLNSSSDPDEKLAEDPYDVTTEAFKRSLVPDKKAEAPKAESKENTVLPVLTKDSPEYGNEVVRLKTWEGDKESYIKDLRSRYTISEIEIMRMFVLNRPEYSRLSN